MPQGQNNCTKNLDLVVPHCDHIELTVIEKSTKYIVELAL